MNREILPITNYLNLLLVFLLMTGVAGCAEIKLVSDYDEKIDKGVTELHKLTEEFLVKLESESGASEATYNNNKKFYEDAKVKASSLRVRADAIHRNSLTVEMLDKLLNNINRLESDHRDKEGISEEEIPLYRGGFNSQFTAILTFELAKKRGEKPDKTEALAPPTKKVQPE